MATPDQVDFELALDWTPNINHVGFFVAAAKGYYSANGLQVRITSPHSDQYKSTPAQRVANGSAQIAICPSESVISYASQVCVAAQRAALLGACLLWVLWVSCCDAV